MLAAATLLEFAVYRPLRNSSPLAKLVSSLGVLLIAQSAMLLAFGVTPQPEPGILPTNVVHLFGAVVPLDRFILTGIVVVAAAALAALYKWTRFGLATRAASENEAAAMLSGLSPNLDLAHQHAARGPGGRRARHPGRLDHPARPGDAAAADHPGAGRRADRLVHLVRHRGRRGSFGIGILDSLIQYASAQSWFPQSGGVSLPGVTDLLAFLIIVVVLFWRGSRIPGRGEIVERQAARGTAPAAPVPHRADLRARRRGAARSCSRSTSARR